MKLYKIRIVFKEGLFVEADSEQEAINRLWENIEMDDFEWIIDEVNEVKDE